MIQRVRISNFQSLKSADLELAPFTVIVGATSSGKSAFLRALRTLMSNASSPDFVTHGEKKADISVDLNGTEVGIQRGPSLSTYRVGDETYPKSGTSVPEEVTAALKGLPVQIEGENLNFSFQFDKPFLLDAPATKVAKVLGDLTNVTVLHEAVREANRRRLDALAKLKVRRGDLEAVQADLKDYADLPARQKLLKAIRVDWVDVTRRIEMLRQVKALIDTIVMSKAALVERKKVLAELPDIALAGLDEKADAIKKLRVAIEAQRNDVALVKKAQTALSVTTQTLADLDQEYERLLTDSGVCPACGSDLRVKV